MDRSVSSCLGKDCKEGIDTVSYRIYCSPVIAQRGETQRLNGEMGNIFTAEACSHVPPGRYTIKESPAGPVRVELPNFPCGKLAWKKREGKYLCKVHLRIK